MPIFSFSPHTTTGCQIGGGILVFSAKSCNFRSIGAGGGEKEGFFGGVNHYFIGG